MLGLRTTWSCFQTRKGLNLSAPGQLERVRKPDLEQQTPGTKSMFMMKVFAKVPFHVRLGNFQEHPRHPKGCRLALHHCFPVCLNKAGHRFHSSLFRGKSNSTNWELVYSECCANYPVLDQTKPGMLRSLNNRAQPLDTQGLESDCLKPSLALDFSFLSVKWADHIHTPS